MDKKQHGMTGKINRQISEEKRDSILHVRVLSSNKSGWVKAAEAAKEQGLIIDNKLSTWIVYTLNKETSKVTPQV